MVIKPAGGFAAVEDEIRLRPAHRHGFPFSPGSDEHLAYEAIEAPGYVDTHAVDGDSVRGRCWPG